MTDAEIAALAAGLTKAQLAAIEAATYNPQRAQWQTFAMFPADRNLRAKGLTAGLWGALTPLGLRVRAHLQQLGPQA